MKGKINKMKVFNSIKNTGATDGKTELTYFDDKRTPDYNITINDNLICIEHTPSGERVYTSLSNVIYFGMAE